MTHFLEGGAGVGELCNISSFENAHCGISLHDTLKIQMRPMMCGTDHVSWKMEFCIHRFVQTHYWEVILAVGTVAVVEKLKWKWIQCTYMEHLPRAKKGHWSEVAISRGSTVIFIIM